MVSHMVIPFSTKRFLFVYMYIDLLKLKAYKLGVGFEKKNEPSTHEADWPSDLPKVGQKPNV